MGHDVQDYGDLQFDQFPDDPASHNIKFPRFMAAASKQISDKVLNIVQSGQTCLSLGGDHSVALGTVHGHAQAEPNMCLIWIDAHTDIHSPLTSDSGNIHGMVLSFLLHELKNYIPPVQGFQWLLPCLRAMDVAYIGIRDPDPAERYIVEKLGMACYTMQDVDRHGIHRVIEMALDDVNPGLKRPIHLSFDIDGLDPSISPSTGTPVPGGLTIREGMYIAAEVARTGKLTGVDLVEVNPALGTQRDQDLTVYSACEIITSCFGKRDKDSVPTDFELPLPKHTLVDSA